MILKDSLRPTVLASSGSWLEMHSPRATPDLLSQILHFKRSQVILVLRAGLRVTAQCPVSEGVPCAWGIMLCGH